MQRFLIILSCVGILAAPLAGHGGETRVSIETGTTHNVFTGLFRSVWAQLNSISPRRREGPATAPVATAGIRGSAAADDFAPLYWKGDLQGDRQFQAEVTAYEHAQTSLNGGRLEAAVKDFRDFIERYPDSSLRPIALLGHGMSLAGLGHGAKSIEVMQQFLIENPRHLLADDVRQLVEELRVEDAVAAASAHDREL